MLSLFLFLYHIHQVQGCQVRRCAPAHRQDPGCRVRDCGSVHLCLRPGRCGCGGRAHPVLRLCRLPAAVPDLPEGEALLEDLRLHRRRHRRHPAAGSCRGAVICKIPPEIRRDF